MRSGAHIHATGFRAVCALGGGGTSWTRAGVEGCLNDNGMLTVICVSSRAGEGEKRVTRKEREVLAVSFGDHKKAKVSRTTNW